MNKTGKKLVTIDDILASAECYGSDNVFSWNPQDARDNKKRNPKAIFDCTWIPFKLRLASGREVPMKQIKFMGVLCASAAKKPSVSSENGNENGGIKNLIIAFRKFTFSEIMDPNGDYAPKKMETAAEQKEEDERAHNFAQSLKISTDKFNEAMEIIDLSYKKIVMEMKKYSNSKLGFVLNKNATQIKGIKDTAEYKNASPEERRFLINKPIVVFSIRQTSYTIKNDKGAHNDEDDDEEEVNCEVALDNPIIRIKLMLDTESKTKAKLVGTKAYNKEQSRYTFEPNVYNARKMDPIKNQPALATVRIGKRERILDSETAGSFITFKSILGGTIEISEIVSSTSGISLSNKFNKLYVQRHRKSLAEPVFTADEFKAMRQTAADEDDDVVIKPSSTPAQPNENDEADNDHSDSDIEDRRSDIGESIPNSIEVIDSDNESIHA